MLSTMQGVPLDQFRGFAASCSELQTSSQLMMQDARPAMIFHVLVIDEGAAQSGSMFPGGGTTGGGGTPLDPLQPLSPPPPAPPSPPATGATTAQEFHRICTKTNLGTCAPICNEMTYGYLLSIEIDGRGTVMTCNKVDGVFSWQGQASLGGYIGADSATFLSAVSSGAAGTYMGTLTTNAGINTDLTIRAGQMVDITGDPGLPVAPSWGGGSFTVQQFGSLSVTHVSFDASVSLTVTGGGSLSLASMTVPAVVLGAAEGQLSGAGSTLRLVAETVPESPDQASLTGTMTVHADGSKTIEPPAPHPRGSGWGAGDPVFNVIGGCSHWEMHPTDGGNACPPCAQVCTDPAPPCHVSEGGRCVGRAQGYGPDESCTIVVGGGGGSLGPCGVFDADAVYGVYFSGAATYGLSFVPGGTPPDDGRTVVHVAGDFIGLPDGMRHFGSNCPTGVLLGPGDAIEWASGGNAQGGTGQRLPDNGCATKGSCGLPSSTDGVGGGWQICFAH